MFIGYLKGVQKVAGWCLSLEGVSGQVELYLRMEFDSGVGPPCFIVNSFSNIKVRMFTKKQTLTCPELTEL